MTSRPAGASATSFAKPRPPKALNQLLNKRLLAYATMAGAGMVGWASHADAQVVYTPVHANLNLDYALDLNHDGITDFNLLSSAIGTQSYLLLVRAANENRVESTGAECLSQSINAAALIEGAQIGPFGRRISRIPVSCMGFGYGPISRGPWAGMKERYLGLGFLVDGQVHYGWARLSVNAFPCHGCLARIEGYAYQTIPGKPIAAGDEGEPATPSAKPTSLGGLALGRRN
jgi:hypothetical protein